MSTFGPDQRGSLLEGFYEPGRTPPPGLKVAASVRGQTPGPVEGRRRPAHRTESRRLSPPRQQETQCRPEGFGLLRLYERNQGSLEGTRTLGSGADLHRLGPPRR